MYTYVIYVNKHIVYIKLAKKKIPTDIISWSFDNSILPCNHYSEQGIAFPLLYRILLCSHNLPTAPGRFCHQRLACLLVGFIAFIIESY